MSIYLGVRCPVCNRKFTGTDDVVVCPVCGAPHHRECYQERNECAFESEHIAGKVWHAPAEPSPPKEEPREETCPRCNSSNPPGSNVCRICGMPLNYMPPAPPGGAQTEGQAGSHAWGLPGLEIMLDPATIMYGNLSPDEEIGGEVARDLALYIGESSAYYLARFKEISQHARVLSTNLAALFLGVFYYFYRKMFLPGAILLGVNLIGLLPMALYLFQTLTGGGGSAAMLEKYMVASRVSNGVLFGANLMFSLNANRFYYHKTVKKVRELRLQFGENRDERAYVEALSHAGGYSKVTVLALVAIISLLYMALYMVAVHTTLLGG